MSTFTVDLVHLIHNWFSKTEKPVSSQGKHLVVLSGGYADLSNIDDNHRFKETKRFWVAGKPVQHLQGEKTMLMYNFVELRAQDPIGA